MSTQIRCPAFPGYCPNTASTCQYVHPVRNCSNPTCNDRECPYLHGICEIDACEEICNSPNCFKDHPFRASRNLPNSRIIDVLRGDNVNYNPSTFALAHPSIEGTSRRMDKRRKPQSEAEIRFIERIHDRIYNAGHVIDFSPFFKRGKCMVCWKRVADSLILPCNHLVLCGYCVGFSNRCVLCYGYIKNIFDFGESSRY